MRKSVCFFCCFFLFCHLRTTKEQISLIRWYNTSTLYAGSFRRSFFCISPCCETPSYKYYLIMIKHYFSPKMYRKNFEYRFTNKNLMFKKFLNRNFAQARQIIQKSLTLDSGKFVNFIQIFGPPVSFSYNFALVL